MTKQKTLIVILLALLALGSILIALFSADTRPATLDETAAPDIAISAPTATSADYELSVTEEQFMDGVIKMSYPKMEKSANPTAEAEFNKAIEAFMDGQAAKIKADAEQAIADVKDLETYNSDSSCLAYELTAAPIAHNVDIVSLGVSYYFNSCGAHPSYSAEAFNYDLRNKKVLALGDIFSGSTPRETLSAVVYEKLKARLGKDNTDEWLKEGTAPTETNFDAVAFSASGVVVSFDDYQIASHAESPEPLLIPWDEIRSKIRPESVVLSLAE